MEIPVDYNQKSPDGIRCHYTKQVNEQINHRPTNPWTFAEIQRCAQSAFLLLVGRTYAGSP